MAVRTCPAAQSLSTLGSRRAHRCTASRMPMHTPKPRSRSRKTEPVNYRTRTPVRSQSEDSSAPVRPHPRSLRLTDCWPAPRGDSVRSIFVSSRLVSSRLLSCPSRDLRTHGPCAAAAAAPAGFVRVRLLRCDMLKLRSSTPPPRERAVVLACCVLDKRTHTRLDCSARRRLGPRVEGG